MTTIKIKPKIQELKKDIHKIEQYVKEWEKELKIKEVSKLSRGCYKLFVDLNMALTKIKDKNFRKKAELDSYKNTYNFLAFIETKANEDLCVLLINNSKDFSKLINEYSKYCTKIEEKYDILVSGDPKSINA